MSELQKVVISGIGALTARGDWTLQSVRDGALQSLQNTVQSTAERVQSTADGFSMDDFELSRYLSSPKTYLDRCSALALAGCALARRDAGLESTAEEDSSRSGIVLGTHAGCLQTMRDFWDKAVERGARMANPILFSHSYFNSPISLCAIEWTLRGPHTTICAGDSSGLEAIRAAHDSIALGRADVMLCGGVEAKSAMRSAGEPDTSDGEASVFLVLENAATASQRGVKVPQMLSAADFERAQGSFEQSRALFGHCGGAIGALALLLAMQEANL